MKKMVRKGFSMFELLFVMVILAALAAMAIPSLSSGTESAALTSMRSDARNIIALVQSKYIDTQDYSKVLGSLSGTKVYAADDSGFASMPFVDGTQIPLSKNNTVVITASQCNGGTLNNGFQVVVANEEFKTKLIAYNSCIDGKIKTNKL